MEDYHLCPTAPKVVLESTFPFTSFVYLGIPWGGTLVCGVVDLEKNVCFRLLVLTVRVWCRVEFMKKLFLLLFNIN